MITYIIQVVLFQAIFLAIYDLFLSKETFFSKNRWYLLSTSVGSFIIPFVKIPSFKKVASEEISIYLPEIVLSPQTVIEQTTVYKSVSNSTDYISIVVVTGIIICTLLFLTKLSRLLFLIVKYKAERKQDHTLVVLPNSKKAFSFFNYIFLGKDIEKGKVASIVSHELVHSKQKHTVDLLFFELLKIVMWFNPLIYIYQKRIATIHEYISDASVIAHTPKETYVNKLINDFFDVSNMSFINQFYKHSLIKKRIKMIMKEKSKQMKQVKYLLIIPVLLSMLFYIACSDKLQSNVVEVAKKQKVTFYSSDGKLANLMNEKGILYEPKETYLDIYYGSKDPDMGVEITTSDLLEEEQSELKEVQNRLSKGGYKEWANTKLYKLDNGRKMIAIIWDFGWIKDNLKEMNTTTKAVESEATDVPFTIIETPPTFPGCEEGDKKCFNKNIQRHVARNFDSKLPNKLNLPSGRKRVVMMFRIDKKGRVVNIRVKAPHKEIEKEATRILELLPVMKPGKQRDEVVAVKYTLPMRIDVK